MTAHAAVTAGRFLYRLAIAGLSGRRRGSALLLVLIMGALLTSLAFVAMRGLSASMRATAVFGDEVRVEELGRSGIDLALAQLSRIAGDKASSGPFEMRLSTGSIAVEIAPETGHADINRAPAAVLAMLIAATGSDAKHADQLAREIVDWRDPNADKRSDATSDAAYRARGLPPQGRRPFATPSELALVLDMTPETLAKLLPLVTTCSARETIDPLTADRAMLTALFDGDSHKVDAFIEDRKHGFARPGDALSAFPERVRAVLSSTAKPDKPAEGTPKPRQGNAAGLSLQIVARAGALTRSYAAMLCPAGDNKGQEMQIVSWRAL